MHYHYINVGWQKSTRGSARGTQGQAKILVGLAIVYFSFALLFISAEGGFFVGCVETYQLHEAIYPLSLVFCPLGRELFSLLGLLLLLPLCLKARPFINRAFPGSVEPSMLSYALFYVVYLAFTWFDGIGARYITLLFYALCLLSFSVILNENSSPARKFLYASYFRSIGDLLGPQWSKNAVLSRIRLRDLYIPLALAVFVLPTCFFEAPTTSDLVVLAIILAYFIVSSIEVRRKRVPAPFP